MKSVHCVGETQTHIYLILKTNFNDAFLMFHDPLTACGRIFNEKGNIPFVIKIEKREEEKKLSPTLTKCFANIPTFSHVHNYL